MAYIEFKNVVKRFGDFTALDHVSLEIPKGAFVTLLGPSGCGKTTLMRQLAGFSEPEEGDVLVDGKRMNGLPPFKRNTPLVFQEYALFPHMTVYENISYGLKLVKEPKEEIGRRVSEMLEMFNLMGLEKRFPREMSGGQQQRVAFARALVMGQEILLLDEPLSNLDAKLRVDVRTELRQIQRKLGITAIYVTHDQDEALSMSDIIAVMRQGRIEQIGTPWEIYFRPANRFVADFVGTVNFLDAKVLTASAHVLTVDHCGMELRVPTEIPASAGEEITLVVRPECIHLAAEGETLPEGAVLNGTIENYSFLGRMIRYWVRVGEETFVIDDANVDLSGARSGDVKLCLDAHKLHILKDGGAHADC
ncbi:ABC transporter ATP-binding protein [uncultured Dysosmobacter sp.]|uniref:ABC transporter ATP-binding protein n=1 Tax=uncultured Dysosmobacter sp. TaxID=2591384 RepID=UPI002639F00F|nr:ABC transporter ATP-binding protein [uncultured Dysosmobacter sp.]